MNGFFGTGFDTGRIFACIDAEVTLNNLAFGHGVRLWHSEGTIHDAHKAGSAACFVIQDMAGFRILIKCAAHTGFDTFRFIAVAAEQRFVPAFGIL